MTEIIPAITPESFEDLREKISLLVGKVPVIHIDAANATLSPGSLWPYKGESSGDDLVIPYSDEAAFEVHLMVKNPEDVVDEWLRAGVERVIVHVESFYSDVMISSFIKAVRSKSEMGKSFLGVEVGLSINLDTPLERLLAHLDEVDFVQFMSIATIGTQGNKFEPQVLDRIREFKAASPHVIIAVDGGINLNNADDLIAAGVDRLVVGSQIVKAEDPEVALQDFLDLVNGA